MSFRDNQDLRPRGAGGWCYAEHELFSVFAPLIGPYGVSVYMAFCRLIPLAAIHADRQVTVRRMAEYSTVARSKCAEEMQRIYRLGMVIETKYLDGRNPTYKLPSLHEVAKVGEAELFRRAGVHHGDTAPFDQEVQHRREQARRAAKRKIAAIDAGSEREFPLLDDSVSKQDDSEGVRTADTARHDVEERSDPHSVSAENVTVSAKPVSVSAESVTVSATAPPLIEEKRSEVKNKNPLPPAEQGEEADDGELARPVLPNIECTFGQPGFAANLPFAASWVMAQAGVTKRRLEPVIVAQLELFCRQHRGEPLENAAWSMARQSRKLHQDAKLLRHAPWGWQRWFAEGHWQRPLPYDPGKSQAANPASVGVWKPDAAPALGERWNEKVRAFVLANAARVAALPGLTPMAAELERLAALVGTPAAEDLEEQLARLEERMIADALAGCDANALAALEAEVDADLKGRRVTWHPAQAGLIRKQIRERSLQKLWGLPRLELFYMEPPGRPDGRTAGRPETKEKP